MAKTIRTTSGMYQEVHVKNNRFRILKKGGDKMSRKSTAKRLNNSKRRAIIRGIGDKWND